MYRILFVCTGNICRSPTAEAIARERIGRLRLAGRVDVDSAGIQGYHSGEAPDRRSQLAAARRGYDLAPLRARRVERADFQRFQRVLALDLGHLEALLDMSPPVYRSRVGLLLDEVPALGLREVPDPYYGAGQGFEAVLDLCEVAVDALFARLLPSLRASEGGVAAGGAGGALRLE